MFVRIFPAHVAHMQRPFATLPPAELTELTVRLRRLREAFSDARETL